MLREEVHWRQKFRVMCQEYIKVLENEGVILDNTDSILAEILHFFGKLYASSLEGPWRLQGLDWSPISIESASWLEHPFSKGDFSSHFLVR